MIETSVQLTKQIAAKKQLETSIKLFFENRDLFSAYTLCCAADGILEGIYSNQRTEIIRRRCLKKPNNFRFSWGEEMEILFKPKYKKEGFRRMNEIQNFLKHADKDHNSRCDFTVKKCKNRIFGTITNYELVFERITEPMNIFVRFYLIRNPHLLKEGHLIDTNPYWEIVSNMPYKESCKIGYFILKNKCPDLFFTFDFGKMENNPSRVNLD